MGKIAWDGPKWGREVFFPTNPHLADILGDMVSHFCWILNSWIYRFPDFQNLVQAGLGPGWAGLEPSGPNKFDFPW